LYLPDCATPGEPPTRSTTAMAITTVAKNRGSNPVTLRLISVSSPARFLSWPVSITDLYEAGSLTHLSLPHVVSVRPCREAPSPSRELTDCAGGVDCCRVNKPRGRSPRKSAVFIQAEGAAPPGNTGPVSDASPADQFMANAATSWGCKTKPPKIPPATNYPDFDGWRRCQVGLERAAGVRLASPTLRISTEVGLPAGRR